MTKVKRIPKIIVLFIVTSFMASQALAFSSWWQCSSRQGGDWSFARAPSICLVNHMQTQSFVKKQYAPILFSDKKSRTSERKRYITELNALAKQVADYYLKKRKPGVSQAELNAFTTGLLTLMHQETVWSHYRLSTDNNVRYMRGDVGHGHGLMQVDDRSHQSALLQGKGTDLIENMMYGLDVYYAAWKKAPSQSCVKNSTDYTARIRSAWAAYNGGPSRICRWKKTTGTFAHHDKDFYKKLQNKAWNNYILDQNKTTSLDVPCLADGPRPCVNNGSGTSSFEPKEGELYKIGSGGYCLVNGNNLNCVDQLNDVNCLELRDKRKYPSQGTLSQSIVNSFEKIVSLDRNAICKRYVTGLIPTSKEIKLEKNINLRKTPGGKFIKTVSSGTKSKILNFQVTSSSDQKRYYQINNNGSLGYVYAGDKDSYNDWSVEVEDSVKPKVIANIGDTIEITAARGINQRKTADGIFVQTIPTGEQLEVIHRIVRGSKNYLYYKVKFKGSTGYIYSGYLENLESIKNWTRNLSNTQKSRTLASKSTFVFLKKCPEKTCEFTSHAIKSNTDVVNVIKDNGTWSLVETPEGNKKGWIRNEDLN